MTFETLPNTKIQIGPIGYAERPLRRDPTVPTPDADIYGSSPQERIATISAALESGIRFFHAAHEREAASLGVSLKELGIRDKITICTTDGDALDRCPDTEIGGEEAIKNAIVRKKELLGIDHLNVFLLYDFRPETHTPARLSGAIRALTHAKTNGDIAHYGTTCYQAYDDLATAITLKQFDPSIVLSRFNYYDQRAAQTLFPLCQTHGIDVIATQTFSWVGGVPFVRFPNTWRYRNLTKNFYGFTAAQAHLYWISLQPDIANILVSMQTPEQIKENVQAIRITKTPTGLESLFDSFVSAITQTREGWLGLRQDEEWEYRMAAEAFLGRRGR